MFKLFMAIGSLFIICFISQSTFAQRGIYGKGDCRINVDVPDFFKTEEWPNGVELIIKDLMISFECIPYTSVEGDTIKNVAKKYTQDLSQASINSKNGRYHVQGIINNTLFNFLIEPAKNVPSHLFIGCIKTPVAYVSTPEEQNLLTIAKSIFASVKFENRPSNQVKDRQKARDDVQKSFDEFQRDLDDLVLESANEFLEEKKYDKAIEIYRELASRNNSTAQNKLGNIYRGGLGVKKDLKVAFSFYEKSAKNGNKYAQFNLGNSYYHGDGCEKNISKALEWLKTSCESGYKKACESHSYIIALSKKNSATQAQTTSSSVPSTNSKQYINCSYKVNTTLGTIADAASTIIGFFGGDSLKSIVAETAGEYLSGTLDHRFQCDFHPYVFKYSVTYFYTGNNKKFSEKETKTFKPSHSKNDVRFATATTSSHLDFVTIRADALENNEEVKNLYVFEIDSENNKMIPFDLNEFLINIVDQYEIK